MIRAHQCRPIPSVRALCGALACAFVAGCGETPPPVPPVEPAAVFVTPAATELRAGETLQLVAQANDAEGRAIGGAPLLFVADAPALVDVTREGLVSATGPVGTAMVRVASGAAETTVSVTVRHSDVHALTPTGPIPPAFAAPPATSDAQDGREARTGAGEEPAAIEIPFGVRATDAFGNPVPGTELAFAIAAGAGTVEPAVATADATGVARAVWRLGEGTGQHLLEVTTPGIAPLVLRTTRAGAVADKGSTQAPDEHLDES